jgi:hypothetical protein
MERIDPFLVALYRITGASLADYFLGTFLLASLAVVVGEITVSLVFRMNRGHIDRLNRRVEKMNRLSSEALALGDSVGYKACNKEANEAFGQLFFNKFGLSAASLWPAFLALAWMQTRFADVEFPLFGTSVGYVFTFVLLYILSRILFRYLRPHLPYFRKAQRRLDDAATRHPD